jgi:iron complex transport system permease protein
MNYSFSLKNLTKIQIILLSLIVLFILASINIFIGPALLSPSVVLNTIFLPDAASDYHHVIVWSFRFPEVLLAVLVGAILGVAGAQMQTILNNPLASPYTLGLSSAASFGASLAIVFGSIIIPVSTFYTAPIFAFFFSMFSGILLYLLAKIRYGSSETIVLAGIAVMFTFSSLVALIQFFATAEATQSIVFWMFGSLQRGNWISVTCIFFVFLGSFPFLYKNIWKLTTLRMGDEIATSLGVNVSSLRFHVIVFVSTLTAIAVSFVGTIGFIGLVAPHIARMTVGEDQRFFAPFSMILGGLILTIASILSKIIIPGISFPIGIITSLIGIPFFLWIILSNRRSYW